MTQNPEEQSLAAIGTTFLPENYSIEEGPEKSFAGTPKLYVLRDGVRISDGWHMEAKDAATDAWGHYHGKIAESRNANREEIWFIQAWMLPDERVFTADHLDFFVPLDDLREVTIATHGDGGYERSSRYFIANLLCDHCGCSAIDDEILSEYGLLNDDELSTVDADEDDDDEEGDEDGE